MGETTDQIAAHIESTRADLGANLEALEGKVKSVTDWKQHFQKNPMTLIGLAFGGGVVLARMMRGRSSRTMNMSALSAPSEAPAHASSDPHTRQVFETWDRIKGALIGVAAARFKTVIGEIVPGFEEHFQKASSGKMPAAPNATQWSAP